MNQEELEQFIKPGKYLDNTGLRILINELKRYILENTGAGGFPIGAMTEYGGVAAPANWLLCDGSAVSRETYAALFAVIGTRYGAGDGSTTFNVPDFRETTPKGIGLTGNSSSHISSTGLTLGQFQDDRIQSHTHDMAHTHNISHRHTGTTDSMKGKLKALLGNYDAQLKPSIADYGFDNPDLDGVWNSTHKHTFTTTIQEGITSGAASTETTGTPTGRIGDTTEVKSLGVNYIIRYA